MSAHTAHESQYSRMSAMQGMLLDPIHENQSKAPDSTPLQNINIDKHYRIKHSVKYEPSKSFKRRRNDDNADSDSDNDLRDDDIWHRPPLDNEEKIKANEDGKALIVGEYEELMRSDESIKAFIDLLIEDETEC